MMVCVDRWLQGRSLVVLWDHASDAFSLKNKVQPESRTPLITMNRRTRSTLTLSHQEANANLLVCVMVVVREGRKKCHDSFSVSCRLYQEPSARRPCSRRKENDFLACTIDADMAADVHRGSPTSYHRPQALALLPSQLCRRARAWNCVRVYHTSACAPCIEVGRSS